MLAPLPPRHPSTFGCIGVGNRGKSNMRAFMDESRTEIVAVCDVDANFRAEAADIAGLGAEAQYNNYHELLARKDIDAVSIATPDHWHALNTIHSAAAGKDIYCENPLSLTIGDGRRMADAVKQHNVVLQTGTWRRSMPMCRRAC